MVNTSPPTVVSRQAQQWISTKVGIMEGVRKSTANPFDLDQNPSGIINLAAAENSLMVKELSEKFQESNALALKPEDVGYGRMDGRPAFRNALAPFLNHFLKPSPSLTIQTEDIVVMNGVGSTVESLTMVLCDPGEGIIIPTPMYGGFDMDIKRRPGVHIVPAVTKDKNNFELKLEDIEDALNQAENDNIVVRAVLLVNPMNPMGTIYSPELLKESIRFCHKHGLHLVVDEIYALSVYGSESDGPEFRTIYSFADVMPDPSRVHILWGFSKDFTINGLRCGMVISKNQTFLQGLRELVYFYAVPSVVQNLLCDAIKDLDWCDWFFKQNQSKLRELYTYVTSRLDDFNQRMVTKFSSWSASSSKSAPKLEWIKAKAGFFVWVNFASCLPSPATFDGERALWLKLIDEGRVCITLGSDGFHCHTPGWFRIIFATPQPVLGMAMDRILKVLEEEA
ncbi:hypothetical protein HK102_004724, partial [Quaeritorhiza haematococci]